ncbi:cupredoxin domain-containing protein [Streptomyces fuscigenes]|uniref:cupredoxin domain-containing protein n=1 Tax=Streptomyces fuscigenes TaxID=1528880 RepID=UPI001F319FE0|nr:cupredoxin domain-containing protein [Streptomyces fuscigenes]MCF3960200.1 cupredoxin domain-containing protein [Streptomyces fuscigenes]
MPTLMRPPRWATLALAASLLILAGCSDGGDTATRSPATPATAAHGSGGASSHIAIKDFMFSPVSLTVRPGARVTVANQDQTPHTVTFTDRGTSDTGRISGGKSAGFTAPKKRGSYSYICDIHQYMKGTLVVR